MAGDEGDMRHCGCCGAEWSSQGGRNASCCVCHGIMQLLNDSQRVHTCPATDLHTGGGYTLAVALSLQPSGMCGRASTSRARATCTRCSTCCATATWTSVCHAQHTARPAAPRCPPWARSTLRRALPLLLQLAAAVEHQAGLVLVLAPAAIAEQLVQQQQRHLHQQQQQMVW